MNDDTDDVSKKEPMGEQWKLENKDAFEANNESVAAKGIQLPSADISPEPSRTDTFSVGDIDIDGELLAIAMKITGLPTAKLSIEAGLWLLIRTQGQQDILGLAGKVNFADDAGGEKPD